MKRVYTVMLMLVASSCSQAIELVPQEVSKGVYALIGPMTGRTYENHGLNANYGFVITEDGVAMIDSGASRQGAQVIERAVRTITKQPIRWVINTGSQDHRWLGNDYFAAQGARIIALKRTTTTQQRFGDQQLTRLQTTLKDRLSGTKPRSASEPVAGDHAKLNLGGRAIELHWYGDAHFPGDAMVWLPVERVLFSGDLIYVDRLLSVWPWSYVQSWQASLESALAKLQPTVIVRGHGKVCDTAKAQHETGAYLNWLLENVKPAAERWEGLDVTVTKFGNEPRWQYLANYDMLHRGNINRSYVQFENNETGEVPTP